MREYKTIGGLQIPSDRIQKHFNYLGISENDLEVFLGDKIDINGYAAGILEHMCVSLEWLSGNCELINTDNLTEMGFTKVSG